MTANPQAAFAVCALLFLPEAFATNIPDPAAFVRDVYQRIAASESAGTPYEPPQDIYTPRLKALFAEDLRRSKGEVGCIDFDFWINAQDSELKNVRVTSKTLAGSPNRMLVVATFLNFSPQEIHFDFLKIAGKWLLDDVHSMGNEPWTLSKLLKCW